MSTPQGEAIDEYSRATRAIRGAAGPVSIAVAAVALAGAAVLVAAEFAPLCTVVAAVGGRSLGSVTAGSQNDLAMVPIAVCCVILTALWIRTRARIALSAIAALGVIALLISLVGDLPTAHASNQLASGPGGALVLADATPAAGMYLETLGAIALLGAGAGGLLAIAPRRRKPRG